MFTFHFFQGNVGFNKPTEPLLKPVILTREHLKEYAKQLASLHEIGSKSNRFHRSILSTLREDEVVLARIYLTCTWF